MKGVLDVHVLVLGGGGFLGRHAAAALARRGHEVSVGSRFGDRAAAFPVRVVRLEDMTAPGAWSTLLRDADAVVNCVGILRERGRATYDAVHHRAPAALAAACARSRARLVHVSALGLAEDARSGFIRSKRAGEAALLASGAAVTVVRPSLLDGDGGFGARWLRRVARWPVHPVPADARGRIAVLDVGDAGEAIARLVELPADIWREADLGGARWHTLAGHLAVLRGAPAAVVRVPAALARLASHACDAIHWTPFSYGHLELLRRDNVPRANALPALLGRAPKPVAAIRNGRAAGSARGRASPPPSAARGGGSTPSARAP
jgi:NADH dehydrogenase